MTVATPTANPKPRAGGRVSIPAPSLAGELEQQEIEQRHREAMKVLNLHQRLIVARAELGGVITVGGVAPQAMGAYAFIKWDDVADKVGAALARAGITMLPSMRKAEVEVVGQTRGGNSMYRAMVELTLTLFNADNPEDRQSITWYGQGDDTGDKAVQKAATSATKYALLKLFQLAGADDTEANSETPAPPENGSPSSQLPPTRKQATPGATTGPVFRAPVSDDQGVVRGCPECGQGGMEYVLWESGKSQVACTNWRDCKYKEPPSAALDGAMRRQYAVTTGAAAAPEGGLF